MVITSINVTVKTKIIIITDTAPQWIRTQKHVTTTRVATPLSYHSMLNIWRQCSTYKQILITQNVFIVLFTCIIVSNDTIRLQISSIKHYGTNVFTLYYTFYVGRQSPKARAKC
jgi:hypothetical protein